MVQAQVTKVLWHPLARRELDEAAAFYQAESVGLGPIFLRSVMDATQALTPHPRIGQRVARGTRRWLVPRFPFGIFYRIEKTAAASQVFIVAVAHHRRRPRYWAGR